MKASRALGALMLVLAPMLAAAPAVHAMPAGVIHYDVSVANLAEHRFRVAISVRNVKEPRGSDHVATTFVIPAWSPGYYQILNFQKDISNFKAVDAKGNALKVVRPNERSWGVLGGGESVFATYDVTANDAGFGFFGSHLDDKTGYINGASALMYVDGGKQLPDTITYHRPNGWKLATPLDPAGTDAEKTASSFRAAGYDELIDCPTQMGMFDEIDFKVKATPFSAVLVGSTKVNKPALEEVLEKVGAAGIDVFGYAPFKRYIFFIHYAMGNFSGGLEHRNSTVLNVWPGMDTQPRMGQDLYAHEYFHAWNVKRLHPAVLGPFDYTQKVRTDALWFCEGVTDYYASILPRMADLLSDAGFEREMANRIRQLQHNEARKRVSAEEASEKAWEGGSMGFAGLSYYLKGSLLGFLLDVKIRAATDNAKSLDDVMRLLDSRYGKAGVGYPEDGLLKAINEVSGEDMTDFYRRYVQGTDEIPWNSILREAGLEYQDGVDKLPYIGVATQMKSGELTITDVVEDSAAEKAGLKAGDRIVTLNGSRLSLDAFQAAVGKMRVGQVATLGIRRGNNALELSVTVGEKQQAYTRIVALDSADSKAQRVRAGLLRETNVAAGATGASAKQ